MKSASGSRSVNTIYDLGETDVALVREFRDLCRGLAEYAGERDEYKLQTVDEQQMHALADAADELYQQLSVVVAYKQDNEITPSDLQ